MFAHAQVACGRRHFEQVSASLCVSVFVHGVRSHLFYLHQWPTLEGHRRRKASPVGLMPAALANRCLWKTFPVFLHK